MPFKKFEVIADHITSKFLKAVFHKLYLVHSWIPWPIYNLLKHILATLFYMLYYCWWYAVYSNHQNCSDKNLWMVVMIIFPSLYSIKIIIPAPFGTTWKCPNLEFFLIRIFPCSEWIRRFTMELFCENI